MLTGRIALGFVLLAACACVAEAEEGTNDTLHQQRKATQLIQDLGSEDFATREAAERALTEMGGGIHPLVKGKLATEEDPEVKARLTRIEKALALSAETDPDKLAQFGRAEALAKRYGSAAKYYQGAEALYAKQAAAEKDEAKQKEWTVLAAKNAARHAKAEKLAKQGGGGAEQGGIEIGDGVLKFSVAIGGDAGMGIVEEVVTVNGQVVVQDGGDW